MTSLSSPPQREVAALVLQGNPKYYDMDAYFSRQTFVYWNCPKFADQATVGLPVLFKRSGSDSGIVAVGAVEEVPKPIDQLNHPEMLGGDLWSGEAADASLKVGVRLDDVRLSVDNGMLPWSELKQITSLTDHPLVKTRLGTVFRLSDTQALDVLRLWGADYSLLAPNAPTASEGTRYLATHRRIERDQGIVLAKKNCIRKEKGFLACEVCGFRYDQSYPKELAYGFIEAHHIKPLSELRNPTITTMDDLILVCANCHRMIHRTKDAEKNLELLSRHFSNVD
ncbi:MAG: HNH endonuclease [Lacipirellulaceae bacterium]